MKQFNPQNLPSAFMKFAQNQVSPCLFGAVNGKRLEVSAETEVTPGCAVTVEYDDALFLGEVVVCRQDGSVFRIEIKVEQVLSGLQSLMALRSQLLCEAPTNMPRLAPVMAMTRVCA